MAVTVNIAAVLNAIAALSVTGVDILDTDEIPESADGIRQPVIYANPDGLITDFVYTRQSFGAGGMEKADIEYTLSFRLCHTPVGSGRGLMDIYPDVVTVAVAFMEAIMTNDSLTGAIDVQFAGITRFGIVLDPSDKVYEGADFAIRIKEYVT